MLTDGGNGNSVPALNHSPYTRGIQRYSGNILMFLRILAHPVFTNLNFHMPMIVDLSHPVIMLTGENGSGKSTLLHSIYFALRGEQVENYAYRLDTGNVKVGKVFLFDAEQHNPRMQLELFQDQP